MSYDRKVWVLDEVIERSEIQNIEDGINTAHDNIDNHIVDTTKHLTSAQNDGLDGANAPGSGNVFATILDIALTIDDSAYNASTWNGDTDAASKNAIRDKIVTIDSDIAINTTHKTSNGSDHTFIDQDVTNGSSPSILGTNITAIPADNINFTVLGTPTYETAQDWFNVIQTSGIISGFELSNSRSDTELDVAAGTGIVKTTDSEIGSSVSFDFAGIQNVTLTGNNINYIYLDYNVGTPQIVATTNRASIELNRHFIIGRVYKNNSTLHILNAGVHLPNMARNEHERLVERDGFTYASGAITSKTGTLNLAITAGVWFLGHNRLTTDALNSSVSDTWEYTHYGAASWITDDATATAVDTTHYNDGTDVLASLGSQNYGTQWVYITTDSHWYVIYGIINGTLSVAQAATPPTSVPSYLEHMGELLAKIIHKQDGTIISIEIIQEVAFTAAGIPDHNDTGNLQGGTAGEYYHLTSAEQVIVNNTSGTNTGDDPANDTIYNESTWNTNLDAATKNAIRDKIELMITDINTNLAKVTNATHTGDVTGSGELTIADDIVTYLKIQNIVNNERILGRVSGADGVVEELTKAQVLSMINVEDDADVTDAGNISSTIVAAAAKGTPIGADSIALIDSADSNTLKEVTITQLNSVLGGSSTVNIFLASEAAYLPIDNPAELVEEAGTTVYAGNSHLTFDDTTSEHAIWRVPMPDYNGGNIVVTAYSKISTTPSGAVTLQYNILTIGLANSEAFDEAVTVDTDINISHSLNTTELLTDIIIASATIDPANIAADDLMIIELSRDVSSDNLVGDGELVGIMIEYTRA